MADVFISWGTPDRDTVTAVTRRLRSLGLDVFEYSEDSRAGGVIDDLVVEEMEKARVYVFFLSAASVGRPWIEKEIAWALSAWRRAKAGGFPERHLIPIRMADLPREDLPQDLLNPNFLVVDVPAGGWTEDLHKRLSESVRSNLGLDVPHVVPAALFAVDYTGFGSILLDALHDVCRTAGIKQESDLKQFLNARYGATADEFKPYDPEEPIKATIERVLEAVNRARTAARDRPIWLDWCTDRLFDDNDPSEKKKARASWSSRPSLAIVDSVSMLDPTLRDRYQRLPRSARGSVVLWAPPFSRHLAEIQNKIEAFLLTPERLSDEYQSFGRELRDYPSRDEFEPYLGFEVGGRRNVPRWLYLAFFDLAPAPGPNAANTAAMQIHVPAPAGDRNPSFFEHS